MKQPVSNDDDKPRAGKYVLVFISLLFLTVLTVTVSYLKHASVLTIIIALTIAVLQGVLIGRYSMRLNNEKPVIFRLLLLAVVFLAAILFLPVLEQINGAGSNALPFS